MATGCKCPAVLIYLILQLKKDIFNHDLKTYIIYIYIIYISFAYIISPSICQVVAKSKKKTPKSPTNSLIQVLSIQLFSQPQQQVGRQGALGVVEIQMVSHNIHPVDWWIFVEVCRNLLFLIYMGVSKNSGTPKWMVKIMENPMNKWMIWGAHPYFGGNTHMDILGLHFSS